MVDVADLGDRIETRDDLGDDDAAVFAYWQAQEAIADREEGEWVKQGRKIVKRYRDERPDTLQSTHRFNILWSNVQTLIPTLYGRTPKPDVERRYKDNDPVGRLASTLLERSLAYSVDAFDFDDVMEAVVEDRLLPGRGVARVLYVPHFGEPIEEAEKSETDPEDDEFEDADAADVVIENPGDEDEEEDSDNDPERKVDYEEAVLEYVFWEDYREGPARKRSQVPWERYRAYLTRDELTKRFGKKGETVNLDYTPKGSPSESTKEEPPPDLYKKACVHEVWDRTRLEVIWYAPGTPDIILDKRSDPLRLPGFFPSVPPLRSTSTNDKMVPVADYVEYQDQAGELDKLTARIDKLTGALKVSGVYAGEEKQVLQQLIDEGTENRLIPVGDTQAWTDKGGLNGIIEWMPIKQIAETLIQLYNARDRVKALLYELTGIGDIMRGMTEPDETAAAQKLKANFSTRRVSPQQRKVAKFARNSFRLLGAVIAEHFSAKTISLMTGFPQLDPVPPLPAQPQPPQQPALPPPQPMPQPAPQAPMGAPNGGGPPQQQQPQQPPPDPAMVAYQQQMAQWQQAAAAQAKVIQSNQQKQAAFQAAVDLIKNDGVHGFRIDIEADSTIAIDEAEDQESRTEFLRAFIPLMQQMVPVAQGNPAMASLAKEITLFGVRGYKTARSLEESITNAFDALGKMPPPQKPGQQDGPDSAADLAVRSKQVDMDGHEIDVKLQMSREKNAVDMAKLGQQSHDSAAKLAVDETAHRAQHELNVAKAADEASFRRTRATSIEAREARGLT